MTLLHIIADYSVGDLAVAEMISALAAECAPSTRFHFTSAPSFDTVSTGFVVAQLGLKPTGAPAMIYANCAPREDRIEARTNNEGEGLVYGVLRNGTKLVAVNSGYSLSFVRDGFESLYAVNVPRGGSQFRSRDSFPGIVCKALSGDDSFLLEQLDPHQVIAPAPESVIGYIDSFGNLKTTLRDGDATVSALKPGQRIKLGINGIKRTVTVASGSFHVSEGDMAFAPGSSGWDRRYWEVFQRGGSAWHTYGQPRAGAPVLLG